MINVSAELREAMRTSSLFQELATITFKSGEVLELTGRDFSIQNNGFTDAAGSTSLPLGVAMARTIHIAILNDDDHLRDCDFVGAKIRLYTTYQLSATVEKIELGTFTVIDPETYGSTVTVTAVDEMWRANRPYSTALAYPTTIGDMYRECCTACGIAFESANFRNHGLTIQEPPTEQMTHRDMLGHIAMLAGGNARVNRAGVMQIVEYDFSRLSSGGGFVLGESKLGDGRLGAGTGDAFSGTTIDRWIGNPTFDINDITVTGVQTTIGGDYDGEKLLVGSEGYVISVENPLMAGMEQECLDLLAEVLIGAKWRKFSGSTPADPTVEFGDPVKLVDRRGRVYYSIVTDINFTFFAATEFSNSAESALRNSQTYSGPNTGVYQAAKKLIDQERSEREARQEELARAIANGNGMYIDAETQEDGSVVYYLHDKPTMEASQNVMKITAEAIGLSTDGGATYPAGFTLTGDMVMRIIAAEGIDADWINAGSIGTNRVSVTGGTLGDFFDVAEMPTGRTNEDGTPETEIVLRMGKLGSDIVWKQRSNKVGFFDPMEHPISDWTTTSFRLLTLTLFQLGPMAIIITPENTLCFGAAEEVAE